MLLQRCRIVLPLITEQSAKLLETRRFLDKLVPIVMRDLVPEMTEQRAIGFAHLPALTLTLGIVRLGQADRDLAALVAGHHRCAVRQWRREEVERQSALRVLVPGRQRETKPQQRVKQTMLGDFDLAPICCVLDQRQIRNHPVVAARRAELIRTVRGNEPVADLLLRIGAVADTAGRVRHRPQAVLALLQRGHGFLGRQIAEPQPAAFAAGVLKIKRLPAVLAFEQLHQGIPGWTLFRAPQPELQGNENGSSSNSLADSANN